MSRCRSPACYDAQLADLVDFAFDRQAIEGFEPQASEEFDPGFERLVGITESLDFFRVRAAHSSEVRHAPQWVVTGFPGHTGQVSPAAWLQTVKTKSITGAPGLANSSQLLLRSRLVSRCAFSSRSSASGCTTPLGRLPALWPVNRPL